MIQNKIYDFLKANKLTDKDQQTFLKEYSDSAKAKELYGFFQANQLTDKDFNSFYDTYLKKKEPLEPLSPDGGKAGTSEAQLGLKPAKIQPTIFKEPSVGEDTVLARKLAKQQRAAAEGTGVRLPAAPKVVAEERAAERALAPKIEKPTETEGQSWLSNTVSALDRGFYKNLIGNPVKGLATVIQYGTEAMTGGRVKEGPVSDALMRFGNWFNNAIDEVAPQDPEFKNSLSDQFAQALGQVGSVVLTGGFGAGGRGAAIAEQAIPKTGKLASVVAATKAGGKELVSQMASPAAISAGLTMGQSEFERAKQAGASDDQAFEAFYKNAAVGSILEKIPVMQFFKRFNNATQGGVVNYLKTKGAAGLTGGAEEMTTEVLQQLYANKTAQDIYNVNQDIFEGLTESGGIGFGVGFLLNAMGARAKVLRNEGKEAEAKVVEDQAKEFESRASKGAPAEPEVPPAAAPVVTEEVKAEEVVTPTVPQTEETLNKYLSTFKRRLAERKKELRDQGVTDVEADQQVKNIEAKIENTQESISKLGEVPPVAEEVRVTTPETPPQVPTAPETQKESIQNIVKQEAELDISSNQLDRLYDEVVKGGGKIDESQIRKILNVGYSRAKQIAEEINNLGVGEVAPEATPQVPAAPIQELKEGEQVQFNLASNQGQKTGTKVTVPGYEDVDFIAVQDGFNYDIYELASGLKVTPTASFSVDDAISQTAVALASKGITSEKLLSKIYSSEKDVLKKLKVNESPAIQKFKEKKIAEEEKIPFLLTEEERQNLFEIAKEAKEKGLSNAEGMILSAANIKKGDRSYVKLTPQRAKDIVEAAEKNKKLKDLEEQQKPYPEEEIVKREDTEEDFKQQINNEYKSDKYDTIPQDIKDKAYEAHKKLMEIANKYGYYPKSVKELKADPVIALSIYLRAAGAKKVETRAERINEAEKLIDETIEGVDKIYNKEFPKEAEVSEDPYYAYYKEGLPTYNIDEFRKNPDILKSDEAYHSIKYPNSFVGLYTDRSLIALENNITPESIKLGDEVFISGKKYAVESIDRIKKDRDSLHLLRIDDKGNFLRQRDLPKKERESEEVDEIEEEELPFGEEKEVKVKKKREITDIKRRALNLEITDNPRGEVMQYFLSGGKISPEALQELFESKKQGYRWKRLNSEERKLRRSLTKDGSPRIEELAESIAGTDRLDQTQDYRNAIEEVILDHDRVDTMAEELVNDFDVEYNAMLKEQELSEIGGEINNQIKDFVAGLPQAQKQEILDVLDTLRLEDGTIDWDTIEKELGIIDPFSEPVIQRLSEKSQKILQDAIQQFKETGRISRFRGEVVLSPEEIRAGDAARGLAEKLRAGKISKKGFRASTGFDVVFDAAIEVVAKALEAGASIADAIESGLKYIRNTDWYKSVPNKKEFEDKFKNLLNEEYAIQESTAGEVPVQPEAGVSEEVEAGVPPTRPPKAPEEGEGEGRKEERRFTERLIETPGLLAAIKKGVAPTLEYIRQTNAMTVQEAEQIINVLGEDKAYSAMKSEDTKGAVRVVLGQVLIKRYNKLAKEAKTKEEKDLYIDTTIDIAEYVTVKLATEAGQTIQAFSLWDKLTPEAQLVFAARQKKKSARRNINKTKNDVDVIKEKFDKANEEAVKEILRTEEVSNTIKKDSQEGVQKAKDRAAKARQKRADIINKYKGKGGITFTTGGLTKEGIEFVGEVAVTYIEEGIAEIQVIVEKVLADIKNISGKEPNETVKREVFEIADKELAKADIDMVKSVKDKKMRIDEIAIQHFTSKEKVKKELAQKFIEQADMSEGNAEALAKRFEEAFDRVVSRKKAEILAKNKKRFERIRKAVNQQAAIKAEPKTLQDEIIKYSNLGAFDTEDMLDYLSDKFKLGQLTKEQATKIKELAEKIQTAPEGTPKREATEDLLAYQANLNGGNWGEVAQGIWYANILSGYRTHEKNVVSTFINSWVDLGAEMIADPKSAPYLIAGYIQGVKKRGLLEAGRTLATGRSPIHVAKIEVPDILERKAFIGGGYNPANWFKYVSRTMKAEDVLSFQGLKEARSYQLARKEASKLGFNTWSGSGWKKVNELLFNTTERYEIAVAQAESEGLKPNTKNWKRRIYELMENSRPTQMTEDAYNFAAHGTFNYESNGTLGAFTNAVSKALDVKVGGVQPGRFVVPFTRIITNVVNNALDYSPVGLIRVAKGARGFKSFDEISLTKGAYKPFTPEQRRIVAVKAAIGISFAAMFQYMAETGQIQISGEGPEDEKKKAQLRESGWQAYSIKIGDKWYSYQLTPLALVLGMLGNFNDAAKYGKDDEQTLLRRLNVAALKFGGMIADMTWINSAGTFLGSFVEPKISEQQRSVEKALSGMARGFVPFSQLTSQATQAYNSIFQVPAKQVNNSWEALYQDLPIARNSLNDKINALGEPVIKDIDIMVSREKADSVWKFLTEKQGWVAPLSKKTVFVFDERLRQDRPLTDNEFYELSKLRGSIIKENIKKILTEGYPVLRDGAITYVLGEDMTSAELNNILSKRIEPMATKEAKARIFGVDYSEMEKDELKAELTELEKEYWGLNDN